MSETVVPTGPDLHTFALSEPGAAESIGDPVAAAERELATARAREVRAESRPYLDFVQLSTSFGGGESPAFAATVAASVPVFALFDGSGRAADAAVTASESAVRLTQDAAEARWSRGVVLHEAHVDEFRALDAELERLRDLLDADRSAIPPDVALELEVDLIRVGQRRTEALGRALQSRRALQF